MRKVFTKEDLSKYLLKLNRTEIEIVSILKKVDDATNIVNEDFDTLLKNLDFKPNDLTIEALEAFLAELRSIFWLRSFGFTEISPIQASNKSMPDFTAKYGDRICAIEVFCLTQEHEQQKNTQGVYVNFDPFFENSKFGRDFISKVPDKKKQLDALNANIKVLLCVVNSSPMIGLNTKEEWDTHLELLYAKLGWKDPYYLGLLTGVNVNGVLSDTIFPILKIV
jgi:hypothetical protein